MEALCFTSTRQRYRDVKFGLVDPPKFWNSSARSVTRLFLQVTHKRTGERETGRNPQLPAAQVAGRGSGGLDPSGFRGLQCGAGIAWKPEGSRTRDRRGPSHADPAGFPESTACRGLPRGNPKGLSLATGAAQATQPHRLSGGLQRARGNSAETRRVFHVRRLCPNRFLWTTASTTISTAAARIAAPSSLKSATTTSSCSATRSSLNR